MGEERSVSSPCKNFCVMTTGRSGSTSLMEALDRHDDIALPKKQIDCNDNELLRPEALAKHRAAYAALLGEAIDGPDQLIDAFYRHNAAAPFAGFKSMPHRHANYGAFVSRSDVTFVTLVREDRASTVASFMLALRKGTWRRHGQVPQQTWTFGPEDKRQAQSILARLDSNLRMLENIPNAIRLSYEEICSEQFHSPDLERLFGRPISIDNPRPPISGEAYTENWGAFVSALGISGPV